MNENCPLLHYSGCGIENIEWVGYVALMEETRNAYRIFVGKPERKCPLDILT
jgi:hypothetical protein